MSHAEANEGDGERDHEAMDLSSEHDVLRCIWRQQTEHAQRRLIRVWHERYLRRAAALYDTDIRSRGADALFVARVTDRHRRSRKTARRPRFQGTFAPRRA